MPRKKSTTSQTTGRTTRRKRVTKSTKSAKSVSDAKPESAEAAVVEQDGTPDPMPEELQVPSESKTTKRRGRRKKSEAVVAKADAEPVVLAEPSANTEEGDNETETGLPEEPSTQSNLDAAESNTIEDAEIVQIEAPDAEDHAPAPDDLPSDDASQNDGLALHLESQDKEESQDEDPGVVVEVMVDQRSPDDENPQPIHPMEAMTAQLSEPMPESLVNDDLASSDVETVTVEAVDSVVIHTKDAVVVEAVAVDVEDDSAALNLTVDELNGNELKAAIATAHRHEEELEAQLMAVREHEHELTQKAEDTAKEAKRLAQIVASADLKEMALKQEIADLKEELTQAKTQVMQAQSQLNDQDKNQREIDKLKGEVATFKEELDEAKRYILQLTDQLSKAQSAPPPSTTPAQVPASTTFPPPLTQRPPHTRVVASPRSQPRRPAPRPVVPMSTANGQKPAGLPPMSTERFSGSAPTTPARPAKSLRTAYTRPGFSKTQPPQLSSAQAEPSSQPMPPLESISRDGSTPAAPQVGAIVPQKSSPIAHRRSRYDTLKPEIKSSDLPQPKVSDSEIGWFD